MIAVSLIEQIVTNIRATYNSMSGVDNLYVSSVIDAARESVLNKRAMSGDKSVPSQLLQYIDLYYDAAIQESTEYTVYQLPRLAQISAAITAPITIAKMRGVAYPLYTSIEKFETMTRRSDMCNDDCLVLVNNSTGDTVRLIGERKNHLRAQAILAEPLKLETFNPYFDFYPASASMNSMIELEIVNLYMKNQQAQAPRWSREGGVS
jgi:hypothetical protein